MLEPILNPRVNPTVPATQSSSESPAESLDEYEKVIAAQWAAAGISITGELAHRGRSRFGTRALGILCRDHPSADTSSIRAVAKGLCDLEQYGLANDLYTILRQRNELDVADLLEYGSSISEADRTREGADRALAMVGEALERGRLPGAPNQGRRGLAGCLNALGGLELWRWQISRAARDPAAAEDLARAITTIQRGLEASAASRSTNDPVSVSRIAQAHLRLPLLRRIRDGDGDRPDAEGDGNAVLALEGVKTDDAAALSYLRWCQALVLADSGNGPEAERSAIDAHAEDRALLRSGGAPSLIGLRQYTQLRRLIEQYSDVWRNRADVGRVAQILQIHH